MLLRDNFIHADLHPGNLLVREVREWGAETPLPPLLRGLMAAISPAGVVLVVLDTGIVTWLGNE